MVKDVGKKVKDVGKKVKDAEEVKREVKTPEKTLTYQFKLICCIIPFYRVDRTM